MAHYEVTFSRSAKKELESLKTSLVKRIFPKIEALADQPRPSGCKKLVGQRNMWRIRIGDYRVVYTVDDGKRLVDVIAVRHRREVYE